MTKLDDAIRDCRVAGDCCLSPEEKRAFHTIASALEELSSKPDATRPHLPDLYGCCSRCGVATECKGEDRPGREFGVVKAEVGGEMPSPLPATLPIGSRYLKRDGGSVTSRSVAKLTSAGTDADGEPGYKAIWSYHDEETFTPADTIDWAHYRRTHSPPPSREGEAVPSVDPLLIFARAGKLHWLLIAREGDGGTVQNKATDADLAAVLAAMPEKRRGPLLKPFHNGEVRKKAALNAELNERLREAERRSESAESRATDLEQQLAIEKAEHEADVAGLRGEVEAARSAFTARSMADTALVDSALATLRPLVRNLERFGYEPCLTKKEAMPDDPTACEFCWKRVCQCPPVAPTPASTLAAVADALPTNTEDERAVDALMARRPVVTRPLTPSAPTPAVDHDHCYTCRGLLPGMRRKDGDGSPSCRCGATTPAVASVREGIGVLEKLTGAKCGGSQPRDSGGERCDCADELNFGEPAPDCSACGGTGKTRRRPDEQRKDPSETAEAEGAAGGLQSEAPQDLGDAQAASGESPGLTPEEAEEGIDVEWLYGMVHAEYEATCYVVPWKKLAPIAREPWIKAIRFAHSEGAKAAKAEGGTK